MRQLMARESTPVEVGLGVRSFFGTVVYTPIKGAFCILRGIGSVGTLIVDPRMAGKVADSADRELWVITPDNLTGEEQVRFVGDSVRR